MRNINHSFNNSMTYKLTLIRNENNVNENSEGNIDKDELIEKYC
jgi:hypothetical protein